MHCYFSHLYCKFWCGDFVTIKFYSTFHILTTLHRNAKTITLYVSFYLIDKTTQSLLFLIVNINQNLLKSCAKFKATKRHLTMVIDNTWQHVRKQKCMNPFIYFIFFYMCALMHIVCFLVLYVLTLCPFVLFWCATVRKKENRNIFCKLSYFASRFMLARNKNKTFSYFPILITFLS